MNVASLFYVYKIILVVTFTDDICFSIRLTHIWACYFKHNTVNDIIII